jgi:hypothetical protein
MALYTMIEAAIKKGISFELIQSFTLKSPKSNSTRLLKTIKNGNVDFVESNELEDYWKFLKEPWPVTPKGKRPNIPEAIKEDIRTECHYACAICGHMDNGEIAHIIPVKDTFDNSPDNLILLCPNHHSKYDYGFEPASNVNKVAILAAKTTKRNSRKRCMLQEKNATKLLQTIIKMMSDLQTKIESDSTSVALNEIYSTEIKHLLETLPDLIKISDENAGRDAELPAMEKMLAGKTPLLSKILIGTNKTSKDSVVRSTVESLVEATRDIFLDLDEEDCPHCGGRGTTGLVGDLCGYCKGSCVVSKQECDDYDRDELDEEDCPHCGGKGTTGLVNDLCGYCKGSCVLSKKKCADYDRDDLDEEDCPHCGGKGTTGLVGDICKICKGSCVLSKQECADYDRDDLDEEDCPHCGGRGTTGLVNDQCGYCKGSCVVSKQECDDYDRDELDEEDCPHCGGKGTTGLVNDLCGYCKGSCVLSKKKCADYDRDDLDEEDCPHCGGRGTTGLVGDICKLCKGSQQVSKDIYKAYLRRYGG